MPLWRGLGACDPPEGARLARRFFWLGLAAVLVLSTTGILQGLRLVGDFPELVGTPYGRLVVAKSGLFAVLLLLAAANRFVFTPALLHRASGRARAALRLSVAVETGLGLVAVYLAARLGATPPGVHQQPLWPFSLRFEPEGLAYPPLKRKLVMVALLLGSAVALIAASLVLRRGRWQAAVIALALVAYAPYPSLALLLGPAHPALYFRSPTGFTATSIAHGGALYATHCVACHGAEGRGPGPRARGFRVIPADLGTERVFLSSDGDLFWALTHGVDYPGGGLSMEGFADRLSEEERWAPIDFLRANAAGRLADRNETWPLAMAAPAFAAECAGGAELDMTRPGRPLRLALDPDRAELRVTPATPTGTTQPCTAASREALAAYSLLAGHAARSEVLVDSEGLLRARSTDAAPAEWTSQQEALARMLDWMATSRPRRGHGHAG